MTDGQQKRFDVSVALQGGNFVFRIVGGYFGPDRFNLFRTCMSGARYIGETRTNEATPEVGIGCMARLKEAGFTIGMSPEVAASIQTRVSHVESEIKAADSRMDKVDAELAKRGLALFGFQRTGIQWLTSKSAALLSDQMGCGKTVQALTSIPENAPVLVIAPAVAKGVWKREVAKWRPELQVTVLSGRGSFRWPEPGEVVAINYDILPPEDQIPAGCRPGTVLIGDEIHLCKSSKSARTKRFRAIRQVIAKNGGKRLGLTATPLLNRPPELWAVLTSLGLEKEAFGSWPQFVDAFNGHPGKWGGYEWGRPNPQVTGKALSRVMLRRTKAEVLKDLPPKRWTSLEVEIDARTKKMCDQLLETLQEEGKSLDEAVRTAMKGGIDFETLSRVRAALATAKVPALLEVVEQYEEQEEPLLVFSAYRIPIDTLAKRDGWAAITGDTPPQQRTQIENDFQAGKLKGVACTIKAGGVAITLTRASNVVFVDKEWTPALNDQAEDRAHRIGSVSSVLITSLVADHDVDRRVNELLSEKRGLIESSVEQAAIRGTDKPKSTLDAFDALKTVETVDTEALARPAQAAKAAPGKTTAGTPVPTDARRRAPANATEVWAMQGVLTLAGLDEDRAAQKNDVGFNRLDGQFGHAMASMLRDYGTATDKQWDAVVRLARRYPRQVGTPPEG